MLQLERGKDGEPGYTANLIQATERKDSGTGTEGETLA